MRILIIDDEPLAQTALASILATRSDVEGFESAGDAVDALDKLRKNAYDVLLLDINLPEVSGIDLLGRLEQDGRALPAVVFVTAHEEHAIAAFENHAVDYVLKPFRPERIGKAMDAAFRRTAGERAAKLVETLPQLRSFAQPPYPNRD